jgi:hypothetical protein
VQITRKTSIHQKRAYTNGLAALEGPMTGADIYMLVPNLTERVTDLRVTASKFA